MTKEEARQVFLSRGYVEVEGGTIYDADKWRESCRVISEWLEQDSCEMTAEEYRQRMIQAFHNADTDGLIAVCVLPTEKEFEHLEWLLKNHYKQESCDDAISRQAVLDCLTASGLKKFDFILDARDKIKKLPPVTPQPKYEDIAKAFQFGMAFGFGEKHDEMDKVIDEIKKVITPQPKKTGHWIFDDECKEHGHCSRCGYGSVDLVCGESHNYCSNCGAWMVEETERS